MVPEVEHAKLALRIGCGLAPEEPTDGQLRSIVAALAGRTLDEATIKSTVESHCTTYGQYRHASSNPSNLTDVLQSFMQALGLK